MKLPIFFKKQKSFNLSQLLPNYKIKKDIKVFDFKTLKTAHKNDLTFFDSIKYKEFALITKASTCITSEKLKKFLPNSTEAIVVKNVLFETAKVLKKFYPHADIDYPDLTLKAPKKNNLNAKIRYRSNDTPCSVTGIDVDKISIIFENPCFAIAPGQSIVFYDNDICLGGAVID